MAPEQVDEFLDQAVSLGTVTDVCADGGEPFLDYDLLLHFLRAAAERSLATGALTNASWVESRDHAERCVSEVKAAGLTNLGISTDQWHRQSVPVERVDTLLEVCAALDLPAARMEAALDGVMFRGRAADKLAGLVPSRSPEELTACPHEELRSPARVHLDCYGLLHLCQGLCVGAGPPAAAWSGYDPRAHPIISLLLEGGPHALGLFAARRGFELLDGYADACHLCYRAREFLREAFPDLLGPDEMYGK
jgi:hypothetical protein